MSSINSTVSTHYLIQDALGSTAAVTDETGTTTTRIAYDAWGNLVSPSNGTTRIDPTTISNLTTIGYTGGELIAEANLVQMGARLYDPASGVFLTPDPKVAAPFDARDWNQYAYVYDNPMSYTDPTGYAKQGPGTPIILPSFTVSFIKCPPGTFGWEWPNCTSVNADSSLDCTDIAEQSNPACHDAIYGLPSTYADDDVFLALAARADALAKARSAESAKNQNNKDMCYVSDPNIDIPEGGDVNTDVYTNSSTITVSASSSSVMGIVYGLGYIIPYALNLNSQRIPNTGPLGWELPYQTSFFAGAGTGTSRTLNAGPQSLYPNGVDWNFHFPHNAEAALGAQSGKETTPNPGFVIHVEATGCQ